MNFTSSLKKCGPFRFDANTSHFFKHGKEIGLKAQEIKVFEVLARHADEWVTREQLLAEAWGDTNVDGHVVSVTLSRLCNSLGLPYNQCILRQRNRGCQLSLRCLKELERRELATTAVRLTSDLEFEIQPDIKQCLTQHNLAVDVIDRYIELEGYEPGWKQEEVVFCNVGPFEVSERFARLLDKYPAQPPVREYYSLEDIETRTKDDERKLIVYAQEGDWRHIFALNEMAKNIQNDDECRAFQKECAKHLLPIDSGLYRHICCHILVVSSDSYILLGRRPIFNRSGRPVPFYPGAWTASLEEQMLRRDPEGETPPDADLFVCVERGVQEELRVPIDPTSTRLLSYGIEWGIFVAVFLFLVKAAVDFDTITRTWPKAHDKVEAIALDATPGDAQTIRSIIAKNEWSPSPLARTWKGGEAIDRGCWHPTARARLSAYLRYLEHAKTPQP